MGIICLDNILGKMEKKNTFRMRYVTILNCALRVSYDEKSYSEEITLPTLLANSADNKFMEENK